MPSDQAPRPYHHGDLRRAVLDAALADIAEHGPASLSLRRVARRAGVSHAAPAHHFGDKAGVLAAVAAEGYRRLGDATSAALQQSADFRMVGFAYVEFALGNRAHFEVMFRPELYGADDEDLTAARDAAAEVLAAAVRPAVGTDEEQVWPAMVGAWSFVHGFATLWLNGNFPAEVQGEAVQVLADAWTTLVQAAAGPV